MFEVKVKMKSMLNATFLPKHPYLLVPIGVIGGLLLLWLFYFSPTKANLNWKEGDKKMYKLKVNSFQDASSAQFGLFNSTFKQRVEGTLNFRVLENSNGKLKLAFQFSPLQISLDDRQMPVLEKLNSQLFLAQWNTDGSVIEWIFPFTIAKKDEIGILQNLLYFQIILSGDKQKWISEESDSLGTFIAKYNSKSDKILKAKVKYKKIESQDGNENENPDDKFQSNIQGSYTEFSPDKEGSWLTSASLREKAEISGSSFHINVSREASLEQIPFNPDKDLDIWKDNFNFEEVKFQMTKEKKNPLSIWEEAEQKRLEKEYQGENFQSLYSKLFKNPNQFTDLANMEKMKAYLKHFPEEALKIPDLLIKGKISGNHIIEVIHLLATTGHKESQSALVSILSNKEQTAHARMQALAGFQEVRNPSEDSANALWRIYEFRKTEQDRDYSNTAVLALGTVALHTKQQEIAGKDSLPVKIKSRILSELSQSNKDPIKLAVLLDATGNTGDSSLFPKIKEYAKSEDKVARASLYSALGNFKDKDSLDFLKNNVTKEESPEGRIKIMQSLLHRKGDKDVAKTIQDSVQIESDVNARQYMLQYLIQNKNDVTDYKKTLEKLLETETNESNRELIYTGIHSN